jgi:hypothetical protein
VATGVRRETVGGYLRSAGIPIRGPGRPGEERANAAITAEVSTRRPPALSSTDHEQAVREAYACLNCLHLRPDRLLVVPVIGPRRRGPGGSWTSGPRTPGPRTPGPLDPGPLRSPEVGTAPGAASSETAAGAAHRRADMQLHLICDALAGGLEPGLKRACFVAGQG